MLAVHHVVTAHVLLNEHEKALDILEKLELKGRISGPLLYSIAQLHALQNNKQSALEYFVKALKWHPVYFSRSIMDSSFDNIRDDLVKILEENDQKFRENGEEFRIHMNRLFEITEEFDLLTFRPSLENQLSLIEKQMNRINVDCYTGYRTGIIRYFQGTFPEVLHEIAGTIVRKHAISLRYLRKKQSQSEKRSGWPYFLLMPIIGASSALSVYYLQKPLWDYLKLEFPFSDIILPNLLPFSFALIVMFLFLKILKLSKLPKKKELENVRLLGKTEREIRKMEKDLTKFWDEKISNLVEVSAIWR